MPTLDPMLLQQRCSNSPMVAFLVKLLIKRPRFSFRSILAEVVNQMKQDSFLY